MGYGRRWAIETVFSTFKRLYGEYYMTKTWKTYLKNYQLAYIYNMLINLQTKVRESN
jgi:hypothetical protein